MIKPICATTLTAFLTMSASGASASTPRMPPQFRGSWCAIDFGSNNPNPQFFRRTKNCSVAEASMDIDAGGMSVAGEANCKLLQATPTRAGAYHVRYDCRSDGDQWTVDEVISIDGRGRLVSRSKPEPETTGSK